MQEEQQTTEVQETTTRGGEVQEVRHQATHRKAREEQPSGIVVAQRIIWFVVGVVNILIAIRFVLLLLGANHSAGFVDFIYGVTSVLVAPFTGIFGEPTYGTFVFEISSLLAIVIYALIGLGLAKLLTLSRPQEEI